MTRKTHGAIAAGHPKTAEAGIEMLRQGGNAFDAVVAAVLASFVAEPALTSVAGGGFLLAHTADQGHTLFDFFTQTPRQRRDPAEVDFYPVDVNFGSVIQQFHVGLGSMAVPGTIGGLFHVHRRLGRLPFRVVAAPAIDYARTGVTVSDFQAYCFTILQPILLAAADMQPIYAPSGSLLQPGETLVMSDLANTLDYLVEAGPDAFYRGDIAHQLVKDCQDRGGYLTLDDLEQYQVIERQPFVTRYRTKTLLTNPPPSSGGTLIAFALALLSQVDLGRCPFGSPDYLQVLAETMRQTNLARTDGYDACLYDPDVAQWFLAPDQLARYGRQVLSASSKWGSTTHVSAIDDEGNAASVTSSNGEGSAYAIPGTGIMVNNMLGEADLHPGGFHCWQPNRRISSMMAPTMVLSGAQPELVLGSGGSNRIRTAILQVICNILDFDMAIDQAVNAPRVHWENGVFSLEPGLSLEGLPPDLFPLDGEVVPWAQQNMFFGGVHAVMQTADGQLIGAGDRRRGGAIAVC